MAISCLRVACANALPHSLLDKNMRNKQILNYSDFSEKLSRQKRIDFRLNRYENNQEKSSGEGNPIFEAV